MRKVETGDRDRRPSETVESAFATEDAVKSFLKSLVPMLTYLLSIFLRGDMQIYTGLLKPLTQMRHA